MIDLDELEKRVTQSGTIRLPDGGILELIKWVRSTSEARAGWAAALDNLIAERDAALARIAELEVKYPEGVEHRRSTSNGFGWIEATMTDQLRKLAVEAFEADTEAHYPTASNAFVRGFIAGRTSVTREQIARTLAAHSTGGVCKPDDPSLAWEAWVSEADAILALLNGENE